MIVKSTEKELFYIRHSKKQTRAKNSTQWTEREREESDKKPSSFFFVSYPGEIPALFLI